MMKIYWSPLSLHARKAAAVLAEKDLDHETQKIALAEDGSWSEDFLKNHPGGSVPALTDDAFTVYESCVIAEYLNDEYPEPPLLPDDSEGRARARMIEAYCDSKVYPLLEPLYQKFKTRQEKPTAEETAALASRLKWLESRLGSGPFISGDFSLADCAVQALAAVLDEMELSDAFESSPFRNYVGELKKRAGFKAAAAQEEPSRS